MDKSLEWEGFGIAEEEASKNKVAWHYAVSLTGSSPDNRLGNSKRTIAEQAGR
jgi:hypothetical protein